MKKLIVLLMVVAMASFASANMVKNGSFDTTFTDGYAQTVSAAVEGSYAYGQVVGVVYMPEWGAGQSGYAVNTDGNPNHFGYANPASASDGQIVFGAGHPAHYFSIWQNVSDGGDPTADGTKDYTLTFDYYHCSDQANEWLEAKIQMLDGPGGYMEVALGGVGVDPGVPLDSWQQMSLTFAANAGFDGSQVQVFLQGSGGSYVDNVSLVPEPATMMLLGLGGLLIRKRK